MALGREEHLSGGTVRKASDSILKAAEAMEDVQLILVISLWKGGSHKEECVK